jgi:hypothetical protein
MLKPLTKSKFEVVFDSLLEKDLDVEGANALRIQCTKVVDDVLSNSTMPQTQQQLVKRNLSFYFDDDIESKAHNALFYIKRISKLNRLEITINSKDSDGNVIEIIKTFGGHVKIDVPLVFNKADTTPRFLVMHVSNFISVKRIRGDREYINS